MTDQAYGQAASSLLPCPFCGPGESQVDPWFDDVSKRWAIGCGRCGASSGRSVHAEGSKEAAIKAWNTRPVPAPVGLERDAMEKALKDIAHFADLPDNEHGERASGEEIEYADGHLAGLRKAGHIARAALSSTDGRSSAGQSETAGWNATQRELEILKLREELDAFRKAERSLSEAYVRLRALIPGAFDTPYAPEPEQIWEITENALKAALAPHCPVECDKANLQRVFDRLGTRLNNVLCEMKPDHDDSIVGFNEAWDVMRAIFKEELERQ